MISDEVGKQLHDRVTRGDALSEQERRELDAWYADQDRTESQAVSRIVASVKEDALMSQTDAIMRQLTTSTRNIRTIARENAALRKEISKLRQQLADRVPPQPA